MELFEAPTVSSNGTAMPVINLSRAAGNTSLTVAYHTPTITTDGTLLHTSHLPAGGTFFGGGRGGTDGFPNGGEWLLAAGTLYLIRVSFAAATANVGGDFIFYEHNHG